MNIVSWHPVLTDHQSHTLQALEAAGGAKVTVVVANEEDATRRAQGWTAAKVGSLEVRVLGASEGLGGIRGMLQSHRDCVHLFGSPFDKPRFMLALWWALWMGLPVYLISEPYSTVAAGYLDDRQRWLAWAKSKLRPWVYRLYGRLLRRRVRGVFAISPLAIEQYRAIGIPLAKLHPFGYFVPRQAAQDTTTTPSRSRRRCRAVFIGNLIARKGVRELAAAAKRLHVAGVDLQIDVYGAGDPSPFAFDGVSIRHAGTIPFGEAQSVIAAYDFLVLPSRYDGWGVVVNESVLAGVPVLCSDRVGAGAFVRKWDCGLTYPASSTEALESSLRTLSTDAPLRERLRAACLASRDRLAPEMAARYIIDVIAQDARPGVPIVNPWYEA